MINRLEEYGFKKVGKWELNSLIKSKTKFFLINYEKERVIYAFVIKDEVKYIGICQNINTTLKDRMSRYQGKAGGTTNKENIEKIRNELENGNEVFIYALIPDNLVVKDLMVDMIKGLETPLIKYFKPKWNKSF